MTLDELTTFASDFGSRLAALKNYLKIDARREEMVGIEAKMAAPDFWDNKETAQELMAKLSSCRSLLGPFDRLAAESDDLAVLAELAADDLSLLGEADADAHKLEKQLSEIELYSFLSGKFDRNDAYVSIHAGAGGTESCDWASMLLRMYRRYFERMDWKEEVIDIQPGDEAGIKSVTLRVTGEFVYGRLRSERGIHRLVRISPFDSNARRHTSFASVDEFPEFPDDCEIEVDEKDLRIDTYRSSGAGGQHVNTTDSAVRITHLPTGTVVCCQNERSQHKNRATAMKMLKARLFLIAEEKRRQEAAGIRGELSENGWGSQIRSYVLQPYQMVKDLRTGAETSNTSGVLDGDIDMFIEAYLRDPKFNV
ncbi:MAG: peptide chain release factor 2 [Victivallaceae bacterium]|nr:peptide chain release factor 2 [Victivallaceae bacterium]